MFLMQRIEELMMHYRDARYAVGEFVLHEQKNLYRYTINEVAEYSYTSKATVVRFAKTLGYGGWREFMKDFISEMKYQEQHKSDVDANYPFNENSSITDIVEGLKKVQIESIQDTADLLDEDMLEQAVSYLLDAKHIVIYAMSPNVFLGELFRRKMITIGKQVDIAEFGEMGIISNTLGPDDCVIMISYSGNNETAEPMCFIPTLKENQVSIIGITSGGDNYIRCQVPCVLTMSSKERLYTKVSNFATEESIQFILNTLFSYYFVKHFQQNNNFKLQNAKLLEARRFAVLNNMKEDK